jgi:hypothetical protein
MTKPLTSPLSAAAATMSMAERVGPIAQAVLRGAAKGLCYEQGGFQAAELWLIDDASRSVGLVARWSSKSSSLATRPTSTRRQLADAPAEVAALAGGAVVLETSRDALAWELNSPALGAAICLPVASDATIHGVLWLLADAARKIPDEAVELAEVVAGRLALEVERNADCGLGIADSKAATGKTAAAMKTAVEPVQAPLEAPVHASQFAVVEPVEAAAWTASQAGGLAAADCWELPGGRLVAIAVAAIDSPDSTQASQCAAVEWLMAEAKELAPKTSDAGLLLTVLNRRLLESPLVGEGLAVTAALMDAPEDADAGIGGVGTWAFAGPTVSIAVRASSTSTHVGDLVPLGWSEHEAGYASRPFELAVNERLVLTAGDPRLTSPLTERRLGDVYRAATADAHRGMTPESCLRRLATSGCDDVMAAVALRRV